MALGERVVRVCESDIHNICGMCVCCMSVDIHSPTYLHCMRAGLVYSLGLIWIDRL